VIETDAAEPPALLDDRYLLGDELGTGVSSAVFRAHDLQLERDVAIKVFFGRASLPTASEREAKLVASLTHHSLVTLLDVGTDRGPNGTVDLYLVMELVDGRNLADWIASGPFAARQVAFFGFDLAEALEYVHEQGIAHRNVKPGNILLADEGEGRYRARLGDFGFATEVGTGAAPGTSRIGTAAYLSPEQASGGEATRESDVYALGLCLIEALTGQVVFPGSSEESIAARLHRDPVLPDDVSPGLATVLRAMTARDPAARPTPTGVAISLRRFLAGDFGRHRRPKPSTVERSVEEERLAALHRYDLLDTPPEGAFDRITALAARSLEMPVSTVSIVDRDRIWFKSHHGLDAEEIGRDPGLCASVVATGKPLYVPDARADPTTAGNPLIAGDLGLQFYAGVPLLSADGHPLGALSVADYRPRTLTPDQLTLLDELGALITHEMEMRLAVRRAVLQHD
jgi:eukaryotic-like serine/threonine-protein kinase